MSVFLELAMIQTFRHHANLKEHWNVTLFNDILHAIAYFGYGIYRNESGYATWRPYICAKTAKTQLQNPSF